MIISLITGLIVGVIFGLVNLPIPAPNKIEGVIGIVGIFIGYIVIKWLKEL